ncbi:MAG: Uma2 family endonuclease, partial [Oscillospiraceae bacterium]|nr:Uma2 family endonuclease [Oscillospiraceae bacterium]
MSLAPKRDDYTFEEWQEMDNNEKIELIDGTLYMISEPSRRHQKVSTNLIVELGSFLKGKKCELYHSPFMYLYTSRRGVKMNLNDFETYIDDTILMRGLDYYKSGNVFSLEFDGKKWIADVSGSDNYTVTVTLSDDGEILDTDCDCPYDWGEYCKHQAAVLFELREELQSGEKPVKSVKKDSLEALLENLDKQTLISMLKEFAGRDKAMRQEIFLR